MDVCLVVGDRVGNGFTRRVKNFMPSSEFPVKGDSEPVVERTDIRASVLDGKSYRRGRARAQIPTVPAVFDVSEKRQLNVLGTPLILNID